MREPSPYGADAAARAAAEIRRLVGAHEPPVLGIVLGSGLGGLARRIDRASEVAFAEVPGFPSASVAGHAGRVIVGQLAGRGVVALAGRFHMYEGHSAALAGFPARVLHALGAGALFVSNAAGGIDASLAPGDLMIITDHLNLMFRNPLAGAVEPGDTRFPDMSQPYDRGLAELIRREATALGFSMRAGVYGGLLGPTYETPAEVRMLRLLGADAVGMSTVPEVIVARAIGMRIAGVSCITNFAAGTTPNPLSHDEVLETTARVAARFEPLVERFVAAL
ncbi:MAG TPA: purine-nucleoside phosphorylase [Gemmatimonadaceae bacterium]|nr:purine-nucleoside phosphorylase [Gemmatimonadaceae bacterium]